MRAFLSVTVVVVVAVLVAWSEPAASAGEKKREKGVSAIRAKGSDNPSAILLPNSADNPVKDSDATLDDLTCDLEAEAGFTHHAAYAKMFRSSPTEEEAGKFPPSDATRHDTVSGNSYTWTNMRLNTGSTTFYVVWGVYTKNSDDTRILVHRKVVECVSEGVITVTFCPTEIWYAPTWCPPRFLRRCR